MEPELELFLIEREAVTAEILLEMKSEKIDMVAIMEMQDADLKKYIPKIGDRLAVIRFCKFNKNPRMTERSSLVERIRKSQYSQEKSTTELDVVTKHRAPHEKPTRLISIGWIMNGIPIRERNGGGARSVSIQKNSKKADILQKALDLFFPNGVSAKYGLLSQYAIDLLDYKEHSFEDNFTVGQMYKMTGLNLLRFYLSTNKIEADSFPEVETRTVSKKKSNRKRRKEIKNLNFESQENTDISKESDETERDKEYSLLNEASNASIYSLDEFLIFDEIHSTHNQPQYEYAETLSSSRTLVVHRGQIFNQMTEKFIDIENLNTMIEVQIIGTNGDKESAFDGGGVFKDALTEYWNEFYERICLGTSTKVPEINYMFSEDKWKAMAKILAMGYSQVKYFPLKICKPFIEYAVFGKTFSDITDAYMEYISQVDADVLRKAIKNFESVDFADILDIFENLECKQLVNKENIAEVVKRLAHTEIVEKPLYILQIWSSVLRNKFSLDILKIIYQKSEVTNEAVLKLLQRIDVEDIDCRKQKQLNFLKKFIREADEDLLKRFLRFCTGADIITCDSITVEFGSQNTPTSHTCSNILVLPIENDSYRVFRSEFTALLKSNMWCMDIV